MKQLLKFLHQLGAIGVIGALAAHLVLVITIPKQSPAGYAAVRLGIEAISRWMLVPSLALVLVSGLLAIAAYRPFIEARWAWVKALLGLSMFEGTLIVVQGNATRVSELAQKAVTSGSDPALMAEALRSEWMGLWTIVALALANVVLGVWRPQLRRRTSRGPGQVEGVGEEAQPLQSNVHDVDGR